MSPPEHTHPHRLVAAHDQMLTLHLSQHVEAHEPREGDPHYAIFERTKARLKRQGLWHCIIDDELCGGQPELHHTHVEQSEIPSVDPEKIERAFGLHFESDEDFEAWVQGPSNLEVLCSNHHRTRFGIHVLPAPLWEAVRYHREGLEAPAHFIPAREVTG